MNEKDRLEFKIKLFRSINKPLSYQPTGHVMIIPDCSGSLSRQLRDKILEILMNEKRPSLNILEDLNELSSRLPVQITVHSGIEHRMHQTYLKSKGGR